MSKIENMKLETEYYKDESHDSEDEDYSPGYYAAFAVGRELGLSLTEIGEFANYAYYGQPMSIHTQFKVHMAWKNANTAKVMANAAEALHKEFSGWITGLPVEEITNQVAKDEYYKLMPLTLSGWNEARIYLEYVNDGLRHLGSGYYLHDEDLAELKHEFNNRTVALLAKYNADNYDSIEDMIISEHGGTTGFSVLLRNQDFVRDVLMPQLMNYGFGADEQLMQRLDHQGIDISDHEDLSWLDAPGNR